MGNSAYADGRPIVRIRRIRPFAVTALVALIAALVVAVQPASSADAAGSPCGADVNPIVCENEQPGTDPETWDIEGAGDPSIQGFATDISVNAGGTVDFKIDTDAAAYTIDIYRTGWYQGKGARLIDSVSPSVPLPQSQDECLSDVATELYDCGTWNVSASWDVPETAVSGVYVARLTRADTGGASHITFIVRKDGNTSQVLFQTSDPTWHAYNNYGGSNFYQGAANGRAYKISYNRPFATRQGVTQRDFYFSSEYATVRFLERNGYDVSYLAGLDTDRRGGELLNHEVFLSVGHDEYWSGAQRANMEAARDAGVNFQFLTGNEGYWRTRYEDSAAGAAGDKRTLVSYKETWGNGANPGGGKIDTSTDEWTGTSRDPRFSTRANGGGSPENELTGTAYMVNYDDLPVTVSSEEGDLRLWRNTGLSSLAAGTSAELAPHTVGYESNEDIDNGFRPDGLVRLSTTVGEAREYLVDHGNTLVPGTTNHHVTLYRTDSDALVFSAASIQWGWGLDDTHDGEGAPADLRMQQAQVNLLADMGAQPGSLMDELVAASASGDTVAPTTTITAPAEGTRVAHGSTVTVTGTASDSGGQVAGVEVSLDGGDTWSAASGRSSWSYTFTQQGDGATTILARAIDDSGNFTRAGVGRTLQVDGPYTMFADAQPTLASADDSEPVEVGTRFTAQTDGYVSAVRFYKGAQNTGTHTGSLWDAAGGRLASVTFTGESATGWQTAELTAPVPVTAGAQYTVSYTAPNGGYAMAAWYWPYNAKATSPLVAAGEGLSGGAGFYGEPGTRPTQKWADSNYYVDVVFTQTDSSPLRVLSRTPAADVSSVALDAPVTATFTRPADAASVGLTVIAAGGQNVAGTVSYDAATRTARFAPAAPYAPSTRYTVAVAGEDTGGVGLEDAGWSFTTRAADRAEGDCPCTLFSESRVPTVPSEPDRAPVTVGTSFTPAVDGTITAVKFYKGAANPGPHTATLWDDTGAPMATATFSSESAGGWQTAAFATPVEVRAGTRYTASYVAPSGGYSATPNAFLAPYTRGPLTVAADGGVYTYADGYPSSSSATDYGVDVVFQRAAAGPIAVTRTPESGATGVSAAATVSVAFDQAVAASTTGTVTIGGAPVPGAWSRSVDNRTLTFTPTSAYPAGAQVSVSVTGVRSASGAIGSDVTWSFGVAAATPASTLLGSTTPQTMQTTETGQVDLGMAFRSSVDGQVTAVRFYKPAGDTGSHVGSLWDAAGRRLAQVTFTGETASGWQRMTLATPVSVTAGQTYTVSYHSSRGAYAYTSNGFAQAVTSGPLTALAPDNGRYRYGDGTAAPTEVWQSTNYFVDIEFAASTQEAPRVVQTSPSSGANAVPVTSAVTASLNRAPDEVGASLALTGPAGAVSGTTTLDAASRTLTFRPSAELARATSYTATVTVDGLALQTWTFRTAEPVVSGGTTNTLFGSATPEVAAVTDSDPVEVGTAFRVSEPGTVTAIRFYKGAGNTGTHRGTLWGPDGAALAQVDFASETATGWQRAALSQPVAVSPGATYVVSYHAPNGGYAYTQRYFSQERVSGSIVGLAADNGRYRYGAPATTAPALSWEASGYFVDAEVVFGAATTPTTTSEPVTTTPSPEPSQTATPGATPTTTPSPEPSPSTPEPSPTPTSTPSTTPAPTTPAPTSTTPPAPTPVTVAATSPAPGASEVAPTTTVSATLSPAPASASIALAGPAGAVAGESAYDPQTATVVFAPAAPLDWAAEYAVTITAPDSTLSRSTWTFATAAEPPEVDAATIFADATPQNPAWEDPDGVQVATRFSVSEAGRATGVRFYKGAANTGQHTGYLWNDRDERIAQVEFVGETAEGWQTARFSAPVALEPGREYRVGLYSTAGRYSVDLDGLAQATTVGPFTLPASGAAYVYSREFPHLLSNHNYWVDVLFEATG